MNREFELKGLYRRLDHLQKFSNRAALGALLVGVVCVLFFINLESLQGDLKSVRWSSGVIGFGVGCYFLGVGTSYLFVRKLKRIIKNSKEKWRQDETVAK
ncbi:MAG: hypothetical protein OXH31_05955 [Gammaproteobacteria bacterium]|nr:hypothetical protein [Gammaproteobacteria bacterium]